jgi:DNA-binding NarL/FixJ family response regulator
VADERSTTRRALAYALRSAFPDCEVQEGGPEHEVLSQLAESPLDLLLLDIHAPGLALLAHVRHQWPVLKVVVMTGYDQPDEAVKALRAGAQGYLVRGMHPDELVRCIGCVLETDVLVISATVGIALDLIAQPNAKPAAAVAEVAHPEPEPPSPASLMMDILSRREREIFGLMVKNLSNKEIAAQLIISGQTVKAHVSRILVKLGQPNRAKAVIHAVRSGLQEERMW